VRVEESSRTRDHPSGAGTLGGSLASWFARSGDNVTLVDQFEPGDPRAFSGGETRFYRCAHGPEVWPGEAPDPRVVDEWVRRFSGRLSRYARYFQ
jgi:hypothetical protein